LDCLIATVPNGVNTRALAIPTLTQNSKIAIILTVPEQRFCVWIVCCYSNCQNRELFPITYSSKHKVLVVFIYDYFYLLYILFVGYKPFVEACIDAGEKSEALKYIPKLTDPRDKSEVSWLYFCFNQKSNMVIILQIL
jgi:Vps16, C-terminal region